MCNFGGSSTNTNQIIGAGSRDPNREKLKRRPNTDLTGVDKISGLYDRRQAENDKSNKTKLTTSDTYQG